MSCLRYQQPFSNGATNTSSEQTPSSTTPGLPVGLRTPSRVKRARYTLNTDMYTSEADNEQQIQQQQQWQQEQQEAQAQAQQQQKQQQQDAIAATSPYSPASHQIELEETRRLVKAFDMIDTSMTEARDKLKTFYKTADETNTLLDMWIRVLSQTEHTQKLLQDPAWEGQTMEEARDREHQERRAAYHLAMEEASRPQHASANSNLHSHYHQGTGIPTTSSSSSNRHLSSSTNGTLNRSQNSSNSNPIKKSSSALAAAAHAHASAIAANRKRNAANALAAAGGGHS
ncbi:hypothetical protein BGX29_008870 [Mortierella sp. GBA35]|nr:hypothetical protein BGX29_008870 [Mortierella sp. GBA35]